VRNLTDNFDNSCILTVVSGCYLFST